jgi:endonuclease YncB( thermonuclease family)
MTKKKKIVNYEENNKYIAEVINVVDGDTFDAVVSLGFGVIQVFRVRLDGVDTPEMSTQKGIIAREFLEDLILNKTIILFDAGKEKYGRARARVKLVDGTDLTEKLIEQKIGIAYDGGKKPEFLGTLSIIESENHS